jgi:hypothetical protein
VTLMSFENGGKARAVNRGLAVAKGDIIVALDADTLFPPETLGRWPAGSSTPPWARWPATPSSATAATSSPAGRRWNMSPPRTWSAGRWRRWAR